jgi:hypothetical protein
MPEIQDVFSVMGFYWEMRTGVLEGHGLRAQSSRITGQVSPVHAVSVIDADQRDAFLIPAKAKRFVWSYPVSDWQRVDVDAYAMDSWDVGQAGLESSGAMKSFLSLGGFIYFDENDAVCGVTTLGRTGRDTGGMSFGEPRRWRREWTGSLVELGRFQTVTMKALRQMGAQYYCWLRPSEIIESSDGSPQFIQPEVEHGGFVFLFHDNMLSTDPCELALNRYFPVVATGDVSSINPDPSCLFRPYTTEGAFETPPMETPRRVEPQRLHPVVEVSERREDPMLDNRAVTYVEMRAEHTFQCWSEEQMQRHWESLRVVDDPEDPSFDGDDYDPHEQLSFVCTYTHGNA